ncbi:MAG: PhzF family phenazine biosynthesis protein [Novosphingobium sp.]
MKLDLLDVFCKGPLTGNPLAVVHGGEGLDASQMLALTRWLGFSETTFLLPPSDPAADYRVRIFYAGGELPFAGHPTLGTCQAWLAAGGKPKAAEHIVQECGIGLVQVRQAEDRLAFKAPPLIRSGALSPDELAEAVRIAGVPLASVVEAVHVANGPKWRLLLLRTVDDVLAAQPAARAPVGTDVGIAALAEPGSGADWELRAFFANGREQIIEDPVTGSFNAGVALHLFGSGKVKGSYIAAQGRMTGADGEVHCVQDEDGSVWIGGRVAMVSAGGEVPSI